MDELGKSFPVSEGMVDAENNSKKPHPNEFCLNCNTKLIDNWCQHCGQKDIPRRQTLSELLVNFISSFWSYEGKFFLTTKYIFTRPGFLATEYNAGRRESYFHPARMYVFVSFLFFLLMVTLPDSDNDAVTVGMTEEDKKDLAEIGLDSNFVYNDSLAKAANIGSIMDRVNDSIEAARNRDTTKTGDLKKGKKPKQKWTFGNTRYMPLKEYDSIQSTLPEDKRDGWITRYFQHRVIELNDKYEGDGEQLSKDFLASFSDNFSKVLFYLMPFFALVLKLLYVRRDYYYSEHLVLTIYYYNFFYLAGCVMMVFNIIPGLGFLSVILGIWIYFYLLVAMKRMYGQSWRKTILKFIIFSFLFTIFAVFGTALNAIATLMVI